MPSEVEFRQCYKHINVIVCRDALSRVKKVVKFHGNEVENVTILYSIRDKTKPIITRVLEFDALKDARPCESINIQVVADFVTVTFYKQESTNSIISRELIPLHATEHLWVKDIPTSWINLLDRLMHTMQYAYVATCWLIDACIQYVRVWKGRHADYVLLCVQSIHENS